ncbi:hypothetical protein SSP531S_13430 [Streptomyces spongiicola]|uniref:Uncharacterized protein n=1 Tax=Streptomyces spongiicola TaxID=1690221 RepID=A0A388SW09_9ACTN|nr:hypothetical protein SSP531S_13430 [Streptomyces spongiicola]
MYLGAVGMIFAGLLFAFNVKGVSEKFFHFVTKYTPVGNATPKTMRFVGAGWVFVGLIMFLPELFAAFSA